MSRSRKRGGRGGRGGGQPATTQQQPVPQIVRGGQDIDLGDLDGQVPERAPVRATFGFGGLRHRVNPELSEVDVIDFMDEAANINPNDPKAITLVKRWAQATVHLEDFDSRRQRRLHERSNINGARDFV